MRDRELNQTFYNLVDEAIGIVDYSADDFKEVADSVDDYGNSGNVWLVLNKQETIDYLEGCRLEKLAKCDKSNSRSEQAILLSDAKILEDMIIKVRQNRIGNIQMGHFGEITFSRKNVKPSDDIMENIRHLFDR